MKDYTLSKEKIAELEREHRRVKDKHQADRGEHKGSGALYSNTM
jgi:hypothetical protein